MFDGLIYLAYLRMPIIYTDKKASIFGKKL